ncbi:MAG: dihydroorotate dehydrogenase (quinone) [Myxococcales bacterium]|nr:dihydroorotate dehydrogenase (quinone) [Myxococcales bacterium]
MYGLIKPILFRQDPELAHHLVLRNLSLLSRSGAGRALIRALCGSPYKDPVKLCGLTFSNRVGLAAGMDKDATAWRGFAEMGFGHVEVGTITPLPQQGNPKPRVFRLLQDDALINRMGFPGAGMEAARRHLSQDRPHGVVLGVNVGKNKQTPLQEAVDDYVAVVDYLSDIADYFTVNVSSPNTPNLRQLQTRGYLEDLLIQVRTRRDANRGSKPLPVFVKLSPDLDVQGLHDALDAAVGAGVDGVIATNTTLDRQGLQSAHRSEAGGMSGRPLGMKAAGFVRSVVDHLDGKLPVIAVGGIISGADATERLNSGAALVQIYTGLVFRGPALVGEIARAAAIARAPL